jgi:hypothetical protein
MCTTTRQVAVSRRVVGPLGNWGGALLCGCRSAVAQCRPCLFFLETIVNLLFPFSVIELKIKIRTKIKKKSTKVGLKLTCDLKVGNIKIYNLNASFLNICLKN